MKDMIEFLRARFDEDERAARAATPGPWRWENEEFEDEPCLHTTEWTNHGPDLQGSTVDANGDPIIVIGSFGHDANGIYVKRPDAEHIIRWDPARVLAEVETKRQILKMHKPVPTGYGAEPDWEDRDSIQRVCPSCGVSDGWHDVVSPCPTLRALALPYADHEDYDVAWTLKTVTGG